MPEEIVIRYAKEIGLALQKLKEVNIIHRDIKS
jgi:serine/threonine protein kinase